MEKSCELHAPAAFNTGKVHGTHWIERLVALALWPLYEEKKIPFL
jgi:hypothetical protein